MKRRVKGYLPVYSRYLDHSAPAASVVFVAYGNRLVSYGNRLPNTWWLKTTEMYSFTVLEDRSLKSIPLG